VPDHDFFFALDLSDEPHFDRMLATLSDALFRFVGYDAASAGTLTTEVHKTLTDGAKAGHQRCDVSFKVGHGQIDITVAFAGGPSSTLSRALPVGS